MADIIRVLVRLDSQSIEGFQVASVYAAKAVGNDSLGELHRA